MKRFVNLLRWCFWVGVALVILAFPLLYFTSQSHWFRRSIHQRAIAEIEKTTGGKVEMGALTFDWRSQVATIYSVVLHGTERAGADPLFKAETIELGLRFDTALRSNVRLSSLVIRKPRVRIEMRPDGTTNLPTPPAGKRNNALLEEVLDLAVRRFDVDDGVFDFNNQKTPWSMHGDKLEVRFVYESAPRRYRGSLSSRQFQLVVPGAPKLRFNADINLDVDAQGATIRSAVFDNGNSSVSAQGRLLPGKPLNMRLDVTGNLNVAELWPPPIPGIGSGKLLFKGTLNGEMSEQFKIEGTATGTNLKYDFGQISVHDAIVRTDLQLGRDTLKLTNLTLSSPDGEFAGKVDIDGWNRVAIDGGVKEITLRSILAGRVKGDPPWSGLASGPIHVSGLLNTPLSLKGAAEISVIPTNGITPVDAFLDLQFDRARNWLQFTKSYVATPSSRLEFDGELNRALKVHAVSTNLADANGVLHLFDLDPLKVELADGKAEFQGTIQGDMQSPIVSGELDASAVQFEGNLYDRFRGNLTVGASSLNLVNAQVDMGPTHFNGQLSLPLANWKFVAVQHFTASGRFNGVSVGKWLPDLSKTGTASGILEIAGTRESPVVKGSVDAIGLNAGGQTIDKLHAEIDFRGGKLQMLNSTWQAGTLQLNIKGGFEPKGPPTEAASWKNGSGSVEFLYPKTPLSHWARYRDLKLGIEGRIGWQGQTSFQLANGEVRIDSLNGAGTLDQLQWNGVALGALDFAAVTKAKRLTITASGLLRGAPVTLAGECSTEGNNTGQWTVKMDKTSLANLEDLVVRDKSAPMQIAGSIEVDAKISGPLFDPDKWRGQIRIPNLDVKPVRRFGNTKVPEFVLRNSGPILMAIDGKTVSMEKAKFEGRETGLELGGAFSFAETNPWDLKVKGSIDLALARTFAPDIIVAGTATVDASVRGSFGNPQVYGRLELKDASLFVEGLPTGLDRVNGALLFDNKRATIENRLRAQAGGGDLTLAGFLEDAGKEMYYRLQATANRVRLRYPEGVSTLADADLTLTGSSSASVLAGNIAIQRSGFTPKSDLGSILTQASKAAPPPAAMESDLLRGMQFDVRIRTAPNATLESSLTSNLQADADLRLRGSALRPNLLGRIQVNQGEVNFFGNKYVIQRGEIGFYNSAKIEPNINMDLETRVRGVLVTISYSGPISKLNSTYRSDPPLQPQEIVALLTVGRDPDASVSVSSAQTTQREGLFDNGANTLLGQAITAPVSGRLQRLFGVSRLKIDPQLSGLEGTPQARVTIEQQVSRDITLTFVTNLARTQQQIVRIEWDLNRQWSVLVVRDENGSFGMDFQYKKRFK